MLRLVAELTAALLHDRHAVVPPTLGALRQAFDPEEQSKLVRQVHDLVVQGQEPRVVRTLRELTSLPWDEVYELFGRWGGLSPLEKERWARRHLFRLHLRQASATSSPS